LGFKQRFTLLWFYAATGFITEIVTLYLLKHKYEYHWTGNIFILSEFVFISSFYRRYIFKNTTQLLIILLAGTTFFISNTIFNSIWILNLFGAGVFCIIYIIYGIRGFYELLQQPEIIYLRKSSFFIINMAFFIYSAANSLLFLFGSYLRQNDFDFLISIWGSFFISMNILHYLLIGIGLYKTKSE
jgi:hypothetical protein